MGNGVGVYDNVIVSPALNAFIVEKKLADKDLDRYRQFYVDLLVNESLTEEELVERLQKKWRNDHKAFSSVTSITTTHHTNKILTNQSEVDKAQVSHEHHLQLQHTAGTSASQTTTAHSHNDAKTTGTCHSNNNIIAHEPKERKPISRDCSFQRPLLSKTASKSFAKDDHNLQVTDGAESRPHQEYRCNTCDISFSKPEMLQNHFKYSKAHFDDPAHQAILAKVAAAAAGEPLVNSSETAGCESAIWGETPEDGNGQQNDHSVAPPSVQKISRGTSFGTKRAHGHDNEATAAMSTLVSMHHMPVSGAEKMKLKQDLTTSFELLADYYGQHPSLFDRSAKNLWYVCKRFVTLNDDRGDRGEMKEIYIYEVDSPPQIPGCAKSIILEVVIVKSENSIYGKIYLPYGIIYHLLSDEIARATLEQRMEFANKTTHSSVQFTDHLECVVGWEDEIARKLVIHYILEHVYLYHDSLRKGTFVGFRMDLLNVGARIGLLLDSNAPSTRDVKA